MRASYACRPSRSRLRRPAARRSLRRCRRPRGRSARCAWCWPPGSLAHSAGLAAESMRTMPYWRMPGRAVCCPMRQAFRTWVRKRAALGLVAHGRAAAGGRPDGRDQRSGAQSFGGELVGQAGEIVIGGIDIGVRQGEEQIDAVEAYAIHFGGGGEIRAWCRDRWAARNRDLFRPVRATWRCAGQGRREER